LAVSSLDGADQRAVVVPLASEHEARYYDLIARQRAAVREASTGRLGYLNIPDMMARGCGGVPPGPLHRVPAATS
jgi:tricorn protease